MLRTSRALALVLATAPMLAFACDAELESDCREGPCGGGLSDPGTEECNIEDTHGLPCPVYKVISENCHMCHVPGGIGPFTLLDYDDTQKPYGAAGLQIWERMEEVIQKDNTGFLKMPLGNDANGNPRWPMSDDKLDVMNAWFATCVPDVGCEHLEGSGGGGGSGGAGGGSGGAGGAGGADLGGGGAGGI